MTVRNVVGMLSTIGFIGLMTASAAYGSAQDTATPVPLPGSLSLLVTGIVGLAGASWWLRRK
jgi:hypothetical protein